MEGQTRFSASVNMKNLPVWVKGGLVLAGMHLALSVAVFIVVTGTMGISAGAVDVALGLASLIAVLPLLFIGVVGDLELISNTESTVFIILSFALTFAVGALCFSLFSKGIKTASYSLAVKDVVTKRSHIMVFSTAVILLLILWYFFSATRFEAGFSNDEFWENSQTVKTFYDTN